MENLDCQALSDDLVNHSPRQCCFLALLLWGICLKKKKKNSLKWVSEDGITLHLGGKLLQGPAVLQPFALV